MKHIQRLIVTSATYRRSSRVDAGGRVRDPLNVFLARGPRLRLDAETLRDNALAISGLLDLKQGGRPVAATREAAEAELPFTYRRSVYVRRQRGAPYGTFTTFDAPDGFACVARRARSNTPLQALALLNEPLFVEAARGLAHRAMREAENDTTEAILGRMFELCVSRRPSAAEITELASLHAAKLRRGGSPAEAAFLCANVLLNLDETMSRE